MTFRHRHSSRSRALAVASVLIAALGSGCVTLYQPLLSLQQPAVVDTRVANFEGLRLLVRCKPGDHLDAGDAQRLCSHVATLFRNQGAEVDTDVPRDGRPAVGDEDARRPDLVVELGARLLHKENSTLLAVLCGWTLTLVPAYAEQTFAQDIAIYDAAGFLLARDSVQARLIDYFGIGIAGVNWVLDLLVRADGDKITGNAASRDLTRDLDGRLSQLVFNARVRSVVLKGFEN